MKTARRRAAKALTAASVFAERHASLLCTLIALLYVAAVLDLSRSTPLWHDELFTWYIAQAPSLHVMWQQSRTLDLNPPLLFGLTRLSFRIFGVGTLAARLPEMAGFMLAMLCLFSFVRRRMGVLYGTLAALFLLESDLFQFAADARPYALLLGSLGLAMIGYQRATEPSVKRLRWLLLLGFGTAALLLSHIFAVLAVAALLLAEAVRTRRNRRLDRPVAAALLLPLTLLLSYGPLLRNHGGSIFPQAFVPDGETIFNFYLQGVSRGLIALSLTGLAVLLLFGVEQLRGGQNWFFTQPEWTLLIALMAAPLLLLCYLMATQGAFFPRYGAVATVGFCVLATALLGRWTSASTAATAGAALLACLIVTAMSGLWLAVPKEIASGDLLHPFRHSEPFPEPCQACALTARLNPHLPLVDASGLTFLEMNQREAAATTDRLFYLTDAAASTKYAHANIFEGMAEEVAAFHLPGRVEAYPAFLREHPHFFVFGRFDYPEDWLLRKLNADGAEIKVITRTQDSYRDTELYEVRIP